MAANGVIGRGKELPWHLPADLKRFKRTTMFHPLIVGRKTWESIGRPLPGRRMVVVSRSQPDLPDGVELASTLERAVEIARDTGSDEAFIAGGAEIYARALAIADRIYWTAIDEEVEGDVRFPAWDDAGWERTACEEGTVDEANPLPHRFLIYDRKREPAG